MYTNKHIIQFIDRIYETEGYSSLPVKKFTSRYLFNDFEFGTDISCGWLISRGFLLEAMNSGIHIQKFISLVWDNITCFDKPMFEELLSLLPDEYQLYMLCVLHRDGFCRQLFTKSEFVKRFEDMCVGDEKVLEMPILNKRPISGHRYIKAFQ